MSVYVCNGHPHIHSVCFMVCFMGHHREAQNTTEPHRIHTRIYAKWHFMASNKMEEAPIDDRVTKHYHFMLLTITRHPAPISTNHQPNVCSFHNPFRIANSYLLLLYDCNSILDIISPVFSLFYFPFCIYSCQYAFCVLIFSRIFCFSFCFCFSITFQSLTNNRTKQSNQMFSLHVSLALTPSFHSLTLA